MAKHEFSADNQPANRRARGKAERTKLLEALKRSGNTEEGFYDLLIERAFNPEDTFAAREVLIRLHPVPKATLPKTEFDFDPTSSPSEQAAQIMEAVSVGDMPADIGVSLINAMASVMKIREIDELEQRIKALETMNAGKEA